MQIKELVYNFLGSSGDVKLDFVIYSLFILFVVKLFLGLIREIFKY